MYSFGLDVSKWHRSTIAILKNLISDKNVIIAKPDKGADVLLLDSVMHAFRENDERYEGILQNLSNVGKVHWKYCLNLKTKFTGLLIRYSKNPLLQKQTGTSWKQAGCGRELCTGFLGYYGNTPLRPNLSTMTTREARNMYSI